jgi:3-isopropylmalate dehydrogenase
MSDRVAIAVIPGDGIGPEVTAAAIPAVSAAADVEGLAVQWETFPFGADHFLETGETLPDDAFERLRDEFGAIFLGALGDPRVPDEGHARDILLGLRFRLDLYINYRPCRLLAQRLNPLKSDTNIDFVIFRENTEGSYGGDGKSRHVGTAREEQVAYEIHTAPKVERIIRDAFEWAREHGKALVTVCDKSNAIPAHALWRRIAPEVAAGFAGIDLEFRYVDAMAMELVRQPERFQVVVTNNLFGDILSDLGAQLVGGLGVAASANLHPGRVGLFEPVHGSAPPLVGTGQANPLGAILSGALMLEHLGCPGGAQRLEQAVRASLAAGVGTPDVGGTATTVEVAEWIENQLRARQPR